MKTSFTSLMILAVTCCSACNSDTITITYKGNTAEVSTIPNDSLVVSIKNADVKVSNNTSGSRFTYVLKGKSDNGTFSLKTTKEDRIELSDLNLTSNEGAAIIVKGKKKANSKGVTLFAKSNTDNTITITACEDTVKHKAAAIHTKGKLNITGYGKLSVIATGKGCKGINVKDDLTISDLTLNVTTSGMYLAEDTTNNGFPPFNPDDIPEEMKKQFEEMRKKFEEMAKNGELPAFPGMPQGAPNGIPQGAQNGMPQMGAGMPPMGGDGAPAPFIKHKYIGKAKAIKSSGIVTIESGIVNVKTSTPGAEGIEGKKGVVINGGEVTVHAVDDAINANAPIYFNGGKTTAISDSNDAVDANMGEGFPMFGMANNKPLDSAIFINGGDIFAWSKAGSPEEGLDCDFCPIEVTDGTSFSIGGGMGELPSVPTAETAKQPTIVVTQLDIKAKERIDVYEADAKGKPTGDAIISITPDFDFRGSASLITSPSFKIGKKYVIKSKSTTRIVELKEQFTICRP